MSNDRLLDTPLAYPLMWRADEHPDAFKLMLEGHAQNRVPQLLKIWVNFATCYELARKFTDGAIAMEKGPSGIYGLSIPAWRMQSGHEPKLVESGSRLIAPGGALASAVVDEEKAKEPPAEEPEKETSNG